ncbi:MAG: RidA family protein [Caulobacteraceae bacterium]
MKAILAAVAASLVALPAFAAPDVSRTYATPDAIIASTVTVPDGYETIYFSGATASPVTPATASTPAVYGNTEVQTESVLARLDAALQLQGLSFADVVKMTVFLVGDPAKDGKMDFAGMMAAYRKHFGTTEQQNRPARSTVQVVSLAGPGQLVEIEIIAVRRAPAP